MRRRGRFCTAAASPIEVLCSWEPRFAVFGRWWQQLFGESEGKEGKGLFPVSLEFSADLHSMGQMIQQGPRNLFETVVRFAPPEQQVAVEMDWKDLDGLNYLQGKTFEDVAEQAWSGTIAAHVDGQACPSSPWKPAPQTRGRWESCSTSLS